MAKYVYVFGGTYSATGKGISCASIALLLKQRGFSVNYLKLEPFWNVNCGIISPLDHGEVYVCDDGQEADLDLGSHFRISNSEMSAQNIYTNGQIFKELLFEQEKGLYLGETIQSGVHCANKVKSRLTEIGKTADIIIVELGGTIGDMEGFAFYEAVRQFIQEHKESCVSIMVAPILWVSTVKEFKTKPLQNAVRCLQSFGITPDILLCRVDREVPSTILDKVSKFTGVLRSCVFDAPDVSSIYHVPIEFYNRHVDDLIVDLLHLKRSSCRIHKYRELVERKPDSSITVGIVGKYANKDAYISVEQALIHSGLHENVRVEINWINSEQLENKPNKEIKEILGKLDAIIIPGGFDKRAISGKIKAIQYARENKIPFLGICLGLQCAVIEFARNVCGLEADSVEFDKETKNPVVHYVEGQSEDIHKSGTMRLGAFDCELNKSSLAFEIYKKINVSERHRHRLEVNSKYVDNYVSKGLKVSGVNPGSNLIEIMELDREIHPFFIGTQAHPEFRSRLTEPAPLFRGLVNAAIDLKNRKDSCSNLST